MAIVCAIVLIVLPVIGFIIALSYLKKTGMAARMELQMKKEAQAPSVTELTLTQFDSQLRMVKAMCSSQILYGLMEAFVLLYKSGTLSGNAIDGYMTPARIVVAVVVALLGGVVSVWMAKKAGKTMISKAGVISTEDSTSSGSQPQSLSRSMTSLSASQTATIVGVIVFVLFYI